MFSVAFATAQLGSEHDTGLLKKWNTQWDGIKGDRECLPQWTRMIISPCDQRVMTEIVRAWIIDFLQEINKNRYFKKLMTELQFLVLWSEGTLNAQSQLIPN